MYFQVNIFFVIVRYWKFKNYKTEYLQFGVKYLDDFKYDINTFQLGSFKQKLVKNNLLLLIFEELYCELTIGCCF